MIRRITADEVAPHIGVAAGDDLDFILREVRAGISQAYALDSAHIVTRAEGSELVVVCFEGRGLRAGAEFIISRAREAGLKSVRYHTAHRWVEKIVADLGFVEVERVHRVMI